MVLEVVLMVLEVVLVVLEVVLVVLVSLMVLRAELCVVYFQFPKIFKRLVSAPTKSYSKIGVTVRRGLKRA